MKMFFNRAIAIIKAQLPGSLAAQHAKQIKVTKERYGKSGVVLQVKFITEAVPSGSDPLVLQARDFLRGWYEKQEQEATK